MDATTHAGHLHGVHAETHHHELNYWQKYIFSTDHKIIGIQYGVMALMFLFFGFCLMMMMRWSIAYPDQPLPLVGGLLRFILGSEVMPEIKDAAGKILGYAMGPDL